MLGQANEANDAKSRASLKQRAAEEASTRKDFAHALDILDSFTAEEREALPEWQSEWRSIATFAIAASYDNHDLQAVQQIIGRAPDMARASLMMMAATRGFRSKDVSYGMTMLTQARRELEKNPLTSDYRAYMLLLDLYAANAPEQAVDVLRLAVAGINNFKVPEKAKLRPFEPGRNLNPIELPAGLFNSDPQMVSATIAELKSPQARVAMRLGLLQACLQRYQGPAKPPLRKADAKPPGPPAPKEDGKPPSKAAVEQPAEQKKN